MTHNPVLDSFHGVIRDWFRSSFDSPTPVQQGAWPALAAGRHALLAAPTGSGKTLAGFLAVIDELLRRAQAGQLPNCTQVVYVSPLRALSTDVRRNLRQPLEGIDAKLQALGEAPSGLSAGLRTGDTTPAERRKLLKNPPHILVTTPESLYLLLTADGGRRMLSDVRTVIVDELHAMAGNKRGAHLALTLERLQMLTGKPLRRIGMSATQRPLDRMARFLLGNRREDCAIVDAGAGRARDLALELPGSPLQAVMPLDVWAEIYDRVADLAGAHDSTLVFVNTRRLCERAARHLSERLGEEAVASHHGSMSKEHRSAAEQRLKSGRLKVLVATASLELGIDIGSVDLVCQLGSPRAISVFLQRVGRSGHAVNQTPKGRLFPLTRGELVENLALLKAAARNELEEIRIPPGALDVLAQQIVAEVACGERDLLGLHQAFAQAWPYRQIERKQFLELAQMLAEGYATRRGRSGAYLHYDSVGGQLRPRRAARITALTNGGTIPDQFDYDVLLAPSETRIGTLNEDFAFESLPGDIFQLGNASYRVLRVASGKVYAEDAQGAPPTIPFWFGDAPGRSRELSQRLAELLDGVDSRLAGEEDASTWLASIPGACAEAARQAVEYLAAGRATLGALPGAGRFVVERFLDELGDMHVVIHSPLGARLNRAWGLALRKRICRKFNIEPQAAALDDSIVISLGPGHSFPLADIAGWLKSASARDVLTQAVLDSPMFPTRWRWTVTTALAVLRNRNGERRPAQFQRSDSEDLMVALFPDVVACAENLTGNRAIPEHPLVRQTLDDCLDEFMDADGLQELLAKLETGEVSLVFAEPASASVLAQEVITAKPYAFLDDAPAEERRTQAIRTRHLMDAEDAARLARPDPQAVADVCAQAWPQPRNADELHDALNVAGFMTESELSEHADLLDDLTGQGRALATTTPGGRRNWACIERSAELRAARMPNSDAGTVAVRELFRSRLEVLGPVTAAELAAPLELEPVAAVTALVALESEGFVVRGRFRSTAARAGGAEEEWCERGLLARIHRRTIKSLREQVRPVSAAEFTSFLFHWQGLADSEARGPESLRLALERLEGSSAAAAAWESSVLPARIEDFSPQMLEQVLASGEWLWKRVEPAPGGGRRRMAANTPICLIRREFRELWPVSPGRLEGLSFGARTVYETLRKQGADFFLSLVRNTGMLRTQVEMALGELAASGLVTSDSFAGLRALITRADKRPRFGGLRARISGVQAGGRWSALPEPPAEEIDEEERIRYLAEIMIRRYGVVFRALLVRETGLPPWRAWLRTYRRMEARGELRGGRFVSGFSGEQFASPEAVDMLRKLRRRGRFVSRLEIASSDPMNLTGVLSTRRVPAHPLRRVCYENGEPRLEAAGGLSKRA
ncbi:DEAD/DEAH box helicase [Candidatus Foliamicus sp.]